MDAQTGVKEKGRPRRFVAIRGEQGNYNAVARLIKVAETLPMKSEKRPATLPETATAPA